MISLANIEEIQFDGNAARELQPEKSDKVQKGRAKRAQKLIRLNEKELRKAKRQSIKLGRVAGMLISSVAVFILLLAMVQGQVKISELTSSINSAENSLNQLQGSQVQLEMQAAGTMEATEIEAYVRDNLSMEKVNQSQITYINIASDNNGVVYEEEEATWWEQVLEFWGIS